ncbi:MAG: GTP-binding protein, partial [Planctomycetota bacterium]
MPSYATEAIRNLAFVGAAGSGKTTLIEALLHDAGVIGRAGRVEDGNTVCDFEDLEKEFHHSLESALVHFDRDGVHVNLIDTPGGSDFIGRAISSLAAIETAIVVIDAHAGIETVTRRVMKAAEECNRPRLIVINKIDNAPELAQIVPAIQETFGGVCRPINLPGGGGKTIVDCFENTSGDSDLGDVGEFHTGLVDQVVEIDDALMEQYLEKGEVSADQLRESFKQALREGHLIPVCFASAREGVGVKELLDTIGRLCPSPNEGNPMALEQGKGDDAKTITPEPDANKPTIAHVFRVTADPYVGKLAVFRVHQGTVGPDSQPQLDDRTRAIRIAHVFKLQGKSHAETDHIIAGDLGAVAKIEEINFGSILHGGDLAGARLRGATLPRPMYGLAIEGTSKGAETKMAEALAKLAAEDPTFEVERVQATGETVIRGLGEQHLRVKLRLLKDRYGVDVETRPPRVAYKETITVK